MLFSQLFYNATDYRSVGFFQGIVFLLLMPFLLVPLKLRTPGPAPLIKNIYLSFLMSTAPLGIILIIFTYLGIIAETTQPAGVGPFLVVISLSIFVKLLFNWKFLGRFPKIATVTNISVYLALLAICIIGVKFIDDNPLDLSYLVGSWITVL